MVKKLASCIGEYRKYAIATPIIMLGEAIMEILIPLIMANMIDYGIQNKDIDYTIRMGVLMILCTLFSLACGAGGGVCAAHAAMGFAKNLRAKLFRKVQTFSFANIDKFSTASLVTRLTTDVTNTQNAFQMAIRMAVRAPAMMIGAAVMAIRINPSLSTVFIVVIPILAVCLFLIMSNAHPRFGIMMEKYDALNTSVQENLTGIRVVKAYVREDYETKKFKKASEALYRFAQNAGLDTQNRADLSIYDDASQVASWARAGVEWAVSAGLLAGRTAEDGSLLLSPGDPVTRAEFAAVLQTLCESVLP